MASVFYIQFIDGDVAWTDGKSSYAPRDARPCVEWVWAAIAEHRALSLTDQRPPTAEGFDGVNTIVNPRFVKSVTEFPVPA